MLASSPEVLLEKQKDIYVDRKVIGQSYTKVTHEFFNGITHITTTKIRIMNMIGGGLNLENDSI